MRFWERRVRCLPFPVRTTSRSDAGMLLLLLLRKLPITRAAGGPASTEPRCACSPDEPGGPRKADIHAEALTAAGRATATREGVTLRARWLRAGIPAGRAAVLSEAVESQSGRDLALVSRNPG